MKTIKVNAHEYQELNQDAKFKVKLWLDEVPFQFETDDLDEHGKPILKTEYASEWDENIIIDHCQANEYLFDEFGNPIHHLNIKDNRRVAYV